MTKEWVEENVRRQLFLDILYDMYGRNDPEHPQHGHYTGLWKEFLYQEAGVFARDQYFNREMMKAEALLDIEQRAKQIHESTSEESHEGSTTTADVE